LGSTFLSNLENTPIFASFNTCSLLFINMKLRQIGVNHVLDSSFEVLVRVNALRVFMGIEIKRLIYINEATHV